jgi:hypothetical protein
MVSLFFFNKEAAAEDIMTTGLAGLAGLTESITVAGLQDLKILLNQVFSAPLWNDPSLATKFFMLPTFQSARDPVRRSYMQVVDHGPLNVGLLSRFLEEPELREFLQQSKSGTTLYGGFVTEDNHGIFGTDKTFKKGTFHLFNDRFIAIEPDGNILKGSAH